MRCFIYQKKKRKGGSSRLTKHPLSSGMLTKGKNTEERRNKLVISQNIVRNFRKRFSHPEDKLFAKIDDNSIIKISSSFIPFSLPSHWLLSRSCPHSTGSFDSTIRICACMDVLHSGAIIIIHNTVQASSYTFSP